VSAPSLRRLKKGEPVGVDILANILVALNIEGILPDVINPHQDEVDVAIENRCASKHISNWSNHELDIGYNAGPIDGVIGRATVSALKQFQHDNGTTPTGTQDYSIIRLLKALRQR